MKLDKWTIEVLNNFKFINESIQIKAGNYITTMSKVGNMLAHAKVDVEFPQTFAVYDLNRFILVAEKFSEGEIEFSDTFLTFHLGKMKIRYGFCDPDTIKIPTKEPRPFNPADIYTEFVITADAMKTMSEGLKILRHDAVVISGENGKLSMSTRADQTTNAFMFDLGETDKTFEFYFEAPKLNVIPKDYKVTLSSKRFMHLETDNLSYWIAPNAKYTKLVL